MKSLTQISLTVFLLSICCNTYSQIAPGIGANTEDPKKILELSDRTLQRLRNFSYESVYEGVGAFAVRSSKSVGKVKFSKLEAGNPLIAKIAAEGNYYPAGSDIPEPFLTAFSGKTILNLRPKPKVLIATVLTGDDPKERSFGFVTRQLGVGTDQLIMYEFLFSNPLNKQIKGEFLEYEGRAIVENVLCHVVYVEFDKSPNGRIRKQRWYISIRDWLPRKVENLAVDDKGRRGGYVLTLKNLRLHDRMNSEVFAISRPRGFTVEKYVPPKVTSPLATGDLAPDWQLADSFGNLHKLSEYKGKVIILDFWATWCAPCLVVMPEIQKLHEKYKKRGVVVFGVSSWEESNPMAYMTDKGYSYGLLLKGETIANSWKVSKLPLIYVVGVDGQIIFSGNNISDDLILQVDRHLAERGL